MGATSSDPVRQFEHSHAELTRLALEIGTMVRAEPSAKPSAQKRSRLVAQLERLRDELLQHFADEEEGLFPFLRTSLPTKADAVDRLESAHDTVCGSLVRLAHVAAHDRHTQGVGNPTLLSLYERFESAYAVHSHEEGALLEKLGRLLDERQRAELTEILRGL